MLKSKIVPFLLCLTLLIPSTVLLATSVSPTNASDPVYISFILNQVEDTIEDTLDKQYKIDWDFDIAYDNGTIKLTLEYDSKDSNAFKKLSKDQLSELITTISKQIISTLGKEIPIEGVIKEDDVTTPNYTFSYKNGNLDIK